MGVEVDRGEDVGEFLFFKFTCLVIFDMNSLEWYGAVPLEAVGFERLGG